MLTRHPGYLEFSDKLGGDALLVEYEIPSPQPRHCNTEIGSSITGGFIFFQYDVFWQGVFAGPSRCSGDGQVKECAQLQSQRAKDSTSRKQR